MSKSNKTLYVDEDVSHFMEEHQGRSGTINFSKFFCEQVRTVLMGKIAPQQVALALKRRRDAALGELRAIDEEAARVLGGPLDLALARIDVKVQGMSKGEDLERDKAWKTLRTQYKAQGEELFASWLDSPGGKKWMHKARAISREEVLAQLGTIEGYNVEKVKA